MQPGMFFVRRAHLVSEGLTNWENVRMLIEGREPAVFTCITHANSCAQPGPWPLAWVLAAVPTLWFPICGRHITAGGRGPQVFCALSVDPTGTVRMAPDGPLLVETVDCHNESCQAAHQWAHAHARHRWPSLVANVRHMLHGNPWTVDGGLLPSHDECNQLLLNRNWIGHSKFPIPVIIATVCRFFRTVEWPEPMKCESC